MMTNGRGQGSGARGQNGKNALRRGVACILAIGAIALILAGCSDDSAKYNGPASGLPYTPTPPAPNPVAVIKTDAGEITLELFENDAPSTVANFISLADKGFYDGLKFHRIIKNFMIQGGDPKGDGSGGPGYKFADEIDDNPNSEYSQYTLAMANSGANTNGSQFFIITNPKGAPHLKRNQRNGTNGHTIFGKVTKGQDVVDKLDKSPVVGEKPNPDVKMLSIKILSKRNHPYEVFGKVMDPAPPPPPATIVPPGGEKKDAPSTGEKKADDKKPDAKPDEKKTDVKPDEKKTDEKKPDVKPNDKKPEEKK